MFRLDGELDEEALSLRREAEQIIHQCNLDVCQSGG